MHCSRRQFLARTTTACGATLFLPAPTIGMVTVGTGPQAVSKIRLDDPRQFDRIQERFQRDYPDLRLTQVEITGEGQLRSEHGGMRVFWIYRGNGTIHLPAGYRTQEGGPNLLPPGYVPDPIDPGFAESLRALEQGLPTMTPPAAAHVHAILNRRQPNAYLVLDHRAAQLETRGREPSLLVFPDLRNLHAHREIPLQPGDFVYIPPGVAHRGLDVFVNVLTVPGFKPHNEIYIDREILDRTGGQAPYNEQGLGRKNYDRLEDFL